MEQLFYELIQVSLKQLDCLSRGPEPEEWEELHETARQQKMTGICYRGVQALFEFGLRVPQDLVIDWMAQAETIEERSSIFTQHTIKVQQKLAEKDYPSSVLIGQGSARDYGDELMMLREPNGINIFVDADIDEVTASVDIPEWDETPVMLHNTIGLGKNPYRNWKLRKWFAKNRKSLFVKDGEMVRPAVSMNVVYLILNLYWRFLYEGITMRELTDVFFALGTGLSGQVRQDIPQFRHLPFCPGCDVDHAHRLRSRRVVAGCQAQCQAGSVHPPRSHVWSSFLPPPAQASHRNAVLYFLNTALQSFSLLMLILKAFKFKQQ